MTTMTDNERALVQRHAMDLREEEKAFRDSPDRAALEARLNADPERLKYAGKAFMEVEAQIQQRGEHSKKKGYEVALEILVTRDRFLLELHRTDSIDRAVVAAKRRLDPKELLSAALARTARQDAVQHDDDEHAPAF